jgi:hypothetical protein
MMASPCKSRHILRKKSHISPYLDYEFLLVARTGQDSKNKSPLLSELWVAKFGSFLVSMDDRQSTHFDKIEINK